MVPVRSVFDQIRGLIERNADAQWWLLLEGAGEQWLAGVVVPAASTTRGREGGLILDDVKAGGVTHYKQPAHSAHIIPLN